MERIYLPDFQLHKDGKELLKKMLQPQLKKLSQELDSAVKKHMEVSKKLRVHKEIGIMSIAAMNNYAKALHDVKSEEPSKKANSKVKKLENKLKACSKRELEAKVKYEQLLQREKELVEKMKEMSALACQEAGDLYESHIQALVSSLTDFTSMALTHDRCSSLAEPLENSVTDLVNSMLESSSRLYIFPDVHAWHKKFGFLEKLPTPFIRASAANIARNPKKALTVENCLCQQLMSELGQTFPVCELWKSKTNTTSIVDTNNNTTPATGSSDVEEDVRFLDEVYVRVVRPFRPDHPEHLKLKLGMRIKQKFPMDKNGMSFGWTRSRIGGPKKYGFYPAGHVVLGD